MMIEFVRKMEKTLKAVDKNKIKG